MSPINFAETSTVGELIASVSDECCFLTWKFANEPLIVKAQKKQGKPKPKFCRNGTFTDAIDLDKLFRERERSSCHMNDSTVKPFFVKFVLNHLRSHFDDISPNVIRRIIWKFCLDDNFKECRLEALNFVAEVVESAPPIYRETRQFWIDVVVNSSSALCLTTALQKFVKECIHAFCDEKNPLEYREILLDILEYDYAGVHGRRTAPELVKDGVRIDELTDLDDIPLALLIVTKSNKKGNIYRENLEDEILFVKIAEKFWENEEVRSRKLYARLICLLIDVNTFVFHNKFYSQMDSRPELAKKIPESVLRPIKELQLSLEKSSVENFKQFRQLIAGYVPFVQECLGTKKRMEMGE